MSNDPNEQATDNPQPGDGSDPTLATSLERQLA